MQAANLAAYLCGITYEKPGPLIVAMDSHGDSLYERIRQNAYRVAEQLYPIK